jgi:hypothetical protein
MGAKFGINVFAPLHPYVKGLRHFVRQLQTSAMMWRFSKIPQSSAEPSSEQDIGKATIRIDPKRVGQK